MIEEIFKLESQTSISRENSYILSYPHILAYFQSLNDFSAQDFVCCSHIVYGWMPTVLDLYPSQSNINLQQGAELLTSAKQQGHLNDIDIEQLARLVNNSLVGASKLLHFTSPNNFAIWDSKIYFFIFNEKPHNYRVNRISNYREYLSRLKNILQKPGFDLFHSSINAKLGYEVTPFRAIELIMFLNSP
jgi:hypothetical protein